MNSNNLIDSYISDLIDTINEWICQWRDDTDTDISIHQYLDMSQEEYKNFIERPQEWAQKIIDKSHFTSAT